jgi:hypothetical protein
MTLLAERFSDRMVGAEVVLHYDDETWVAISRDSIDVHWPDGSPIDASGLPAEDSGVLAAGFSGEQLEYWVRIQRLVFRGNPSDD